MKITCETPERWRIEGENAVSLKVEAGPSGVSLTGAALFKDGRDYGDLHAVMDAAWERVRAIRSGQS